MKRQLFLAVAVAMTVISAIGATRADSIREKLLDASSKEVLVAVHRGDWRNFAENSIEGINSAIEMGADIIEVDLRRTADGQLVLMHDSSIKRSTTGKGEVKDLTLAELRKVTLRSGVGEWTPYRIPTLEEALIAMKGKVMINLDKAFDYFDQVYEIIERTGTTSQIIMKGSADAATVKSKYDKYLDKVIYMPIVNLDKEGAVARIQEFEKELNSPVFELVYRTESGDSVAREIKTNLSEKSRIWYNSLWKSLSAGHDDFESIVNVDNGYGYLIDQLGASVIQTDQPARLLGYLYDRKLKKINFTSDAYKRYRKVVLKAEKEKNLKRDWANFTRYSAGNDSIIAGGKYPSVVFLGNSITDFWRDMRPDFFVKNNIVGRGISGQVSSQMLVRFQSDVVNLHPKAVVILAGTNDIAKNNGQIEPAHVMENIQSMCQLAKANGIVPILASVLPANQYRWSPGINPVNDIRELNNMIKAYAEANKIEYVDYYSTLVNDEYGLSKEHSKDGVHPTVAGYKVMERVVMKSVKKYLTKR